MKNFKHNLETTYQHLLEVSTVWAKTFNDRRKFQRKLVKILDTHENRKPERTLISSLDLLFTPLPSRLMKMLNHFLGLRTRPNGRLGSNPKNDIKRERDNKEQLIPSNQNNNKHARHKDLSQGSATLLRSTYILIVKMTTKVRVFSTSLSLPSNQKGQFHHWNF